MMSKPVLDAVVVGGGPAGCSAAIRLALCGARVALIEAQRYPHDKLCGEFLSPECAGMLDEMGLGPALRALQPAPIHTARITTPHGVIWQAPLPGTAWGLTRRALDAALAEQAAGLGVQVCTETTVTEIEGDLANGWKVQARSRADGPGANAEWQARVVIAAHGKRAGLDRALGREFLRHRQPFMALKAHFAGPPIPGRMDLYAFPGGYCGVSECEGGIANVGVLAHESAWQQATASGPRSPQALVDWIAGQNPKLGEWLGQAHRLDERWFSISQVPFTPKGPTAGDVLLAGDAAGLIVPLAGDGVAMALRGGEIAARHAAGFLQGRVNAADLPRRYAAEWARTFAGRLALGRALQVFMLRPALLDAGLWILNQAPALGRLIIAGTRERPARAQGEENKDEFEDRGVGDRRAPNAL